MATKNAINSSDPIEVAAGGSGAATLTDHSPLIGSGTAAISDVVVGTTGTLFVGAVGADPFFDDSATGDFTFTSSTASQTRVLTVSNTDNTGAASSAARLDIIVGGGNVGDPQIKYAVTSATTWSTGIDNSDSDEFKISPNANLGTTPVFVAATTGEITKPIQPAFLAKRTSVVNNVTGNGTVYSYVCNSEIFDQGADYNTGTGQFTASVTGRYMITSYVRVSGAAPSTEITTYINSSNRTYVRSYIPGVSVGDYNRSGTSLVDMDAGDIVYPQVMCNGAGADTVDLFADGTSLLQTAFSGVLIC